MCVETTISCNIFVTHSELAFFPYPCKTPMYADTPIDSHNNGTFLLLPREVLFGPPTVYNIQPGAHVNWENLRYLGLQRTEATGTRCLQPLEGCACSGPFLTPHRSKMRGKAGRMTSQYTSEGHHALPSAKRTTFPWAVFTSDSNTSMVGLPLGSPGHWSRTPNTLKPNSGQLWFQGGRW